MIIVAGYLSVDPSARENYVRDCAETVRLARAASGCLDFAICADVVEPGRVDIYERWNSREELERFRGSGPSSDQQQAIIDADVREYEVSEIE